jgi:lysozyme
MRHITINGLEFTKGWEVYKGNPYDDGYGYITWGYGHCRRGNEPIPEYVSEDDALILLAKDVGIAERAVLRYINVPLDDGQFDAIASMTFNAGNGALQRSRIRMLVNRGEYEAAAEMFPKSFITSNGIKSKGLIRRRLAEQSLFRSQ